MAKEKKEGKETKSKKDETVEVKKSKATKKPAETKKAPSKKLGPVAEKLKASAKKKVVVKKAPVPAEPAPVSALMPAETAAPIAPEAKIAKGPASAPKPQSIPHPDAHVAALTGSEPMSLEEEITHSSFSAGKRILFVTSEVTPLASTGGLGDAVAGLSKALQKHGHDVRIVMPLYRSIDRNRFQVEYRSSCCVHFGNREEIWVGVWEGRLGTIPIWFVDYERYFGRQGLYDEPMGPDNGYRFGVLSKAALQITKDAKFIPHVIHVHDWMTSPVCVFLKTWDRILSPLSSTGSVLTIHNLGYQGKCPPGVLEFYGLGREYFHADAFEDFGVANLLKGGIQFADAITTVSPTYAREILGPIGGQGLGPYIGRRRGDLFGILNGVDTDIWNPETDPILPARYSRHDLAGKAACKRALQERFGLEVNPRLPIFGIVSRFAAQKGFDLVRGALPQALRDMAIQVVAVGSGDRVTESFMRWMGGAFPGKANAHVGFSHDLAHLVEAGADFFIMPSIYEPCGLNQMYSSLYGTLPIVRATGGLDDTVENYDESRGTGTGFKFWEISDRSLYFTIGWANSTWWDRPDHYRAMQQVGMAKNFTWDQSAREYELVYECALRKRLAIGA